MRRINRRFPLWIITIPIILVAFAFVTVNFNMFLLHNDEGNTIRHLITYGERNSFEEVIKSIRRTSPEHVPAYYLQLSLWADMVGLHFVMLRTFSAFYFLLSLAFLYRFVRELFDSKTAMMAMFLMAFSAFYIYFSHNLRMYSLIVFQTIGILWTYWRISVSNKRTRWYHYVLLYGWSVTHSLLIFPLLAIGAYHLLCARKT